MKLTNLQFLDLRVFGNNSGKEVWVGGLGWEFFELEKMYRRGTNVDFHEQILSKKRIEEYYE